MAAINTIPEKLINFRVYQDDVALLGTADVELPDIEMMTETLSGSGIAGEYDSPVLGHTQGLEVAIKGRAVSAQLLKLVAPKAHMITARGSVQQYDAGAGEFRPFAYKVTMRGPSTKVGLGKMEVGKPQDNEVAIQCSYLKVEIDGAVVLELDKFNCKFVVDGTDYLASVREHLGMEG